MYIETWRWRIVLFCLGSVLLWVSGYCLLNVREVPLNLCWSETSVVLQRINLGASVAAFLGVGGIGGFLVTAVCRSVVKGFSIDDEAPALDIRATLRVILANFLLLLALLGCILLGQRLLQRIQLGSSGDGSAPPRERPAGR